MWSLVEQVNEKLIQFGVFTKDFSIDEQMVPYFVRHPGKILIGFAVISLFCQLWDNFLNQFLFYVHILGNPIHFGFKNWVLESDDGYSFKVIPYENKENGKTGGLYSTLFIKGLLEVIQHPQIDDVYLDDFFFSIQLLHDLATTACKG